MATIGDDANGRKRILFVAGDGKRRTIRVGKATTKQAETFKVRIERLISASITGSVDDETSRWVAGLDDTIHARLAAVGLVKARNGERDALGPFIDSYIDSRPELKARTLTNLKQVRRWLVDHFHENHDMRQITTGDAEAWRLFMLKGGLGANTVRRHIGRARQLYKAAMRRGFVEGPNPFDGMSATVRSDKSRQFFVTRAMTDKVVDACPDAQWKLMVVLSRYGGLRCPSEHLALTWSDINWEQNRIRVPSPKTEHIEGKDCRFIPLFPELRQHLLDVYAAAEEGSTFVISRYRDGGTNLRTQFTRIIRKAGLIPWPKPWHNLRSTRQTELAEQYPIHVVCAWIGNSRAVAQEHYLQLTDAHFSQAAQCSTVGGGTHSGKPDNTEAAVHSKAAQNPAQYAAESARMAKEAIAVEVRNMPILPRDSASYELVQTGGYPRQDSNL